MSSENVQVADGLTFESPDGAWDMHTHVFGPFDRFPLPQTGAYTPPIAGKSLHEAMVDQLGFSRALLIQPSPYMDDHQALLDAIEHSQGRFLGIGSCNRSTDDQRLVDLRAQGVIGLRFVGVAGPAGGAYPGTQGLDEFDELRSRLLALRMHAQFWGDTSQCADLAFSAARDGMTVVFDHLAGLRPTDLPGSYGFDRLVDAVSGSSAWIKLTYLRRSAMPNDYRDMQATVCALAEAVPNRVIWGSDWPFVRLDNPPAPDVLIRQLRSWLGEEAFTRCVADNAAALISSVGGETP